MNEELAFVIGLVIFLGICIFKVFYGRKER